MALKEIYWPGDGVGPEPPPPSQGYVSAAATCAALLLAAIAGAPVALAMATLEQAPRPRTPLERGIKRAWQASTSLRRRIPDRWWLLWRLLRLLWSPAFTQARQAVRAVAVTPGMRESRMWGEIGQRTGRIAGVGENVFRHLLATEAYGPTPARQAHVRDTALQLAYLALKER